MTGGVEEKGQSPGVGPIVQQTIDDIHTMIERGEIRVGGRLPSERDLAEVLYVSRSTVRSALGVMRERGEVEVRRGRSGGAYVNPDCPYWNEARVSIPTKAARLIDRPTGVAAGFSQLLAAQGFRPQTAVLSAGLKMCPLSVCESFRLKDSRELFKIERVRSVDGAPVSFEQTFVSPLDYPGFLEFDLTDSIYRLLREECGAAMERVDEQIEVVAGFGKCARSLGAETSQPLLRVLSRAVDAHENTVVVSRDYYRPDRVRLTTAHAAGKGVLG